MAKKQTRTQKLIEAVKAKNFQWTFEVKGSYNPSGVSNFLGKIKDESGKVVMTIKEDEDFNQVTRLLKTSKYMKKLDDMKGLAEYIWDRNLLPMEPEKRDEWNKKKRIPLDITLLTVV